MSKRQREERIRVLMRERRPAGVSVSHYAPGLAPDRVVRSDPTFPSEPTSPAPDPVVPGDRIDEPSNPSLESGPCGRYVANDHGGYVEVDLGGNANTGFVVDQSLGPASKRRSSARSLGSV
jgi:hypothetical protein